MKDDTAIQDAVGISRYAIGDDAFIKEAESDLKEMRLERVCGDTDVYLPTERVETIETVEAAVAKEFRVPIEDLHAHGHCAGKAKGIALELCCQLTGKSQREIGNHFGYSHDSSVSRQRRQIRGLLHEDGRLNVRVSKLKKRLLVKC